MLCKQRRQIRQNSHHQKQTGNRHKEHKSNAPRPAKRKRAWPSAPSGGRLDTPLQNRGLSRSSQRQFFIASTSTKSPATKCGVTQWTQSSTTRGKELAASCNGYVSKKTVSSSPCILIFHSNSFGAFVGCARSVGMRSFGTAARARSPFAVDSPKWTRVRAGRSKPRMKTSTSHIGAPGGIATRYCPSERVATRAKKFAAKNS